ncbi:AAA family ATPase [Nodularia sp. UHCC 0506]|uniref:AAA family ATPase n=1 Tax=Nodularia sp. UHCC 0506 TaxID=3110243 RepID=UPI002B21C97D|nr:AAA family ATPase [Nodularia sp. UHCC 0506]MEA5516541.1 AAA family ATPase [Nodularia sp. UHCC 0506]
MNVTEILQIVDKLVFTETDKHLDDLQKKIIEEVFKGKTYQQIAEIYDYDEGYIGDESRKLFKILSERLDENINKSNFCWTIERVTNSNRIISFENNNISLCPNYEQSNQKPSQQNNHVDTVDNSKKSQYDLTLAPKITYFQGREQELKLLYDWTLKENIPLIAILGLRGIGKTTLVKRFVDLNLQRFELIIWKNLKIYQSSFNQFLHETITEYSENIKPTLPEKSLIYQFSELLRQKKCLIIFDDVQTMFTGGEFAGKYQDKYQDYQEFLQLITELEHQSNIILISQEQPPGINCLNQELWQIESFDKCLELSELDNIEILKNMGLKSDSEDDFFKLIKLYTGNSIYLKDVASLIINLFAGNISEFLAENSLIITKNINLYLSELFNRLSPIEQEIVWEISKYENPLSREDLRQNLSLSSTDLINGLQSLCQRYVIKKQALDKVMFTLDPVFLKYLHSRLI